MAGTIPLSTPAEYECILKESHKGHMSNQAPNGANGINLRNLDTRLTAKVTRCVLRTALDLAYSNRWIADWLFPTASTSHPPLTPEAFDNALAIHLSHTLSAPVGMNMNYSNAREMIMNKETDLLVVPVCRMSSTTAGYTFCTGRKFEQLTGHSPVTHVAGDFLMSRFIFDTVRRQFLIVSPMPSEGVIGILQTTFHCDGSCERNWITSPYLHYNADFLPSTILTSQCNLETRDLSSSPPPPTDEFPDCPKAKPPQNANTNSTRDLMAGVHVLSSPHLPNLNQSMDDLLNELTNSNSNSETFSTPQQPGLFGESTTSASGISSSSQIAPVPNPVPFSPSDNVPLELGAGDPTFDQFLNGGEEISFFDPSLPQKWNFDADGTTDDGVGVPRKPGPCETSAGAFDMSSLLGSLAKLEKHVKGSFFCLRAKSDRIDPNTGELLSRQTGQQVSAVTTLDPVTTKRLRTIAAQSYYGTTLSPKIDSPLNTVLPAGIEFFARNRSGNSTGNGHTHRNSGASSLIASSQNSYSSVGPNLLAAPPPVAINPMNRGHGGEDLVVPSSWMVGGSGQFPPPPATHAQRNGHVQLLAPRLVPNIAITTMQQPGSRQRRDKGSKDPGVDKAELKKIRNRLSAAKSNQRRRIQLEAQRKELENLQVKAVELERLKQKMTEENARLRAEVFGFPIPEMPVSQLSSF